MNTEEFCKKIEEDCTSILGKDVRLVGFNMDSGISDISYCHISYVTEDTSLGGSKNISFAITRQIMEDTDYLEIVCFYTIKSIISMETGTPFNEVQTKPRNSAKTINAYFSN